MFNHTENKFRSNILLKSILLFLYVYTFSLSDNFSFLITERISIILVFSFLLLANQRMVFRFGFVDKQFRKIWAFQCFMLIYVLILLLIRGSGTSITYVEALVNYIVFALLAYFTFSRFFVSVDELMQCFLIISLFQSIVILLTIISPSFAILIDESIVNRYSYFDYQLLRAGGYQGGLACITSTGTFQLSLGLIACIYRICKGNRVGWYSFLYIFIVFISTTVARTSLVLGVVGFVFIFIWQIKNKEKNTSKPILIMIAILLLAYLLANITGILDQLPDLFSRLLSLKTRGLEDGFFNMYFRITDGDNGIPALSWDTLFGLGIVQGYSGNGIYVMSDGGYIRTYAAIGLILAVINYVMILAVSLKCRKYLSNIDKFICVVFVAFLLIGEFKEPFIIYKRFMIVLYYVYMYLAFRRKELIADA